MPCDRREYLRYLGYNDFEITHRQNVKKEFAKVRPLIARYNFCYKKYDINIEPF